MKNKQLTRAEFQVMSILWNLPTSEGHTSEILERYDDPKPAYTTLATFLKILSKKGYVEEFKKGSRLFFRPIVTKEAYAETFLAPAKDIFFDSNIETLCAFFLNKESLTQQQADSIIELVRQRVNAQ